MKGSGTDPERAAPDLEGTALDPDVGGASSYAVTPRTIPARHPERVSTRIAEIDAVLDQGLVGHVGVTLPVDHRALARSPAAASRPHGTAIATAGSDVTDGTDVTDVTDVTDGSGVGPWPRVLPLANGRLGEVLYLHTSRGSRLARSVPGAGLPACFTVTLLDGLVLARSQFHHSMNYRSVVVHGRLYLVDDPEERDRGLRAIVEHGFRGRADHSRSPAPRELAATAVLRLSVVEATVKSRQGPPRDDVDDLTLPYWAGVVPVRSVLGSPEPAPDLSPAVPIPAHLAARRRPGTP